MFGKRTLESFAWTPATSNEGDNTGWKWWSGRGSNPRPPRCERGALPAELPPHFSMPREPARASKSGSGESRRPGRGVARREVVREEQGCEVRRRPPERIAPIVEIGGGDVGGPAGKDDLTSVRGHRRAERISEGAPMSIRERERNEVARSPPAPGGPSGRAASSRRRGRVRVRVRSLRVSDPWRRFRRRRTGRSR